MKKIQLILGVLIVIGLFGCTNSNNQNDSSNGNSESENNTSLSYNLDYFQFELIDDGYELVRVTDNNVKNILIPPSYEGKPVVSIGYESFYDCNSLESITIPSSITSIGEYAFFRCSSLERVNYGGTISQWASIDFDSSSSNPLSNGTTKLYINDVLQENIILDGIDKIGNYAFFNYYFIKTVTIKDGVTSIGKNTFYRCNFLTSITIPSSVTNIGEDAFIYCDSLTIYCEVSSTPSGWDSSWNYDNRPVYWGINENNFIEKDGIQYVIVNEKAVVTRYVGTSAYVEIPTTIEINGKTSRVTNIAEYAFSNCYYLTNITIPNSVTSIEEYAFYLCDQLQSVTFEPNSKLESIGGYAFDYCRSLTTITIPSSVTSIGEGALNNCNQLQSVIFEPNSKLESIGDSAFSGCSFLTSITIPSSVTIIGNNAFSGCISLTTITIPSSVTSIGYDAFSLCDFLTIYCEVSSKPSGWDENWNSNNRPVYWSNK